MRSTNAVSGVLHEGRWWPSGASQNPPPSQIVLICHHGPARPFDIVLPYGRACWLADWYVTGGGTGTGPGNGGRVGCCGRAAATGAPATRLVQALVLGNGAQLALSCGQTA